VSRTPNSLSISRRCSSGLEISETNWLATISVPHCNQSHRRQSMSKQLASPNESNHGRRPAYRPMSEYDY